MTKESVEVLRKISSVANKRFKQNKIKRKDILKEIDAFRKELKSDYLNNINLKVGINRFNI